MSTGPVYTAARPQPHSTCKQQIYLADILGHTPKKHTHIDVHMTLSISPAVMRMQGQTTCQMPGQAC